MQTIEEIINNYYQGLYNSKIRILVTNLKGVVLFVTSGAALLLQVNPYLGSLNAQIQQFFQQKIIDKAIKEEFIKILPAALVSDDLQRYFLNIPYNGGNRSFDLMVRKINNTAGVTVGIEAIINDYVYFPLRYYFHYNIKPDISERTTFKELKLTEREFLVLYHLVSEYTQDEIAELLAIKRGSVSKIIYDRLYNKFKLNKKSSEHLIETALKMKINMKTPISINQGYRLARIY